MNKILMTLVGGSLFLGCNAVSETYLTPYSDAKCQKIRYGGAKKETCTVPEEQCYLDTAKSIHANAQEQLLDDTAPIRHKEQEACDGAKHENVRTMTLQFCLRKDVIAVGIIGIAGLFCVYQQAKVAKRTRHVQSR